MTADGIEITDRLIDAAEVIQQHSSELFPDYLRTQFADTPLTVPLRGGDASVDITPLLFPALALIDALARRCAELEGITPEVYYGLLRTPEPPC